MTWCQKWDGNIVSEVGWQHSVRSGRVTCSQKWKGDMMSEGDGDMVSEVGW